MEESDNIEAVNDLIDHLAKAKLEFDLNDHDDRMHHLRCVKSTDMAIVLFQLSYNTKKECENIVDGVEGKAGSDMQKGVDLVFKKSTNY